MLAVRAYGLGHRPAATSERSVTHRINMQSNHILSTSLSASNANRASDSISDRAALVRFKDAKDGGGKMPSNGVQYNEAGTRLRRERRENIQCG